MLNFFDIVYIFGYTLVEGGGIMIKSYVGENIKNRRKALGMSQCQLADKLGVSDKTVSSWEINRTEPSMVMLEKMCEVLRCKKTDIIGKSEYDVSGFSMLANVDTDKLAKLLTGMESSQYLDKLMSLSDVNREMIFSMIDRLYALEHGSDKPQ